MPQKLTRGELRFLIGPNWAGKTRLLDLITGKTKPIRGKIIFEGETGLTKRQEHDLVRLGIARKFQTPSVFAGLGAYENMDVAVGFRRRLSGLLRPMARDKADWVSTILEQTGLNGRAKAPGGASSRGK